MADKFTKQTLKVVVAQICQTIGWNAIQSSSHEILVDALRRYIEELTKTTNLYAAQFNRTKPNLDDLGLAFKAMGIEVRELKEYVDFVESVPCKLDVPKYPIPKDSHLNFLKPGSKEVVTRPVHVHEHLPPTIELSIDTNNDLSGSPQPSPTFKRPGDPLEGSAKRARLGLEEEGRPLREISSVMMTTGGFISASREGKLPEPKFALPVEMRSLSPPPQPAPTTVYSLIQHDVNREKERKKRPPDGVKEKEKSRKKPGEPGAKKVVSMKELAKFKALKSKSDKSHAAARPPKEKSLIEKLAESPHLVVTPVPSEPPPVPVAKLATEPDRHKANILKRISKVKEEEPSVIKEEIVYPPMINPLAHKAQDATKGLKAPEHKKKKKDKEKKKKHKEGLVKMEDELEKRPKTPDVIEPLPLPPPPTFPFFPHGLIPSAIANPLIPRFPLPMRPNFPNLPMPPPHFMHPRPDTPDPMSPSSSTKSPLAILLNREKKNKEHKKKDKKKKDKKDKPKKDKKEKKKEKSKDSPIEPEEKHKEHKTKDKKEKKEKRKEKEREKEKKIISSASLTLGPAVTKHSEAPGTREKEMEKEKAREREKEMEREKAKEMEVAVPKLTLKLPPAAPEDRPSSKIVEPEPGDESPEIARFSSLFSKAGGKMPEQKPLHVHTESLKVPKDAPVQKSPGTIIDKDGNKVWICPACSKPDDGTPMIGCDECDAWYHWVCVGIQVPPDENEDWYCRVCIVKKQGSHEKKKRGRKKKPPV